MRFSTIKYGVDPMNPQQSQITGPYIEEICINGKKRKLICYIPEEARASAPGILVIPDEGISAEEMYLNSNWADIADSDERNEKVIIFYLEAENGTWNTEDPKTDLDYIMEVYLNTRAHHKCCAHEAKLYLVGYGKGGTLAQMAAMDNPAEYAGVVSIGAPDVSEKIIEKIGNSTCTRLNGYEDPDGKYGYKKNDFFVPSWIIDNKKECVISESNTAEYWKKSGKLSKDCERISPNSIEYRRVEEAPYSLNQDKETFKIRISCFEYIKKEYGNNINGRIWTDFLRKTARWMGDPGGNLRVNSDPVSELNMEYHYENIDGWMREYYIYIPTCLRKKTDAKVPLVFAMHGYTGSGEIYIGHSGWHKVAEKYGFIVAFPSACHGLLNLGGKSNDSGTPADKKDTELPAWNVTVIDNPNAPDELAFFDSMIEKICTAYPIDRKRIYITGHSLGSLMTQYLAMSKPDVFAAANMCSGILFGHARDTIQQLADRVDHPDTQIPVWMLVGEREEWLLDAYPTDENDAGQSIYVWMNRNKMKCDKPTNFENHITNAVGQWTDYDFCEENVPIIRFSRLKDFPHAVTPNMSFRIWEDFFSKFERGEDGKVVYRQ